MGLIKKLLNITGLSKGGTCSINGKTYQGTNITVCGNKVIIDGVEQDCILEADINVYLTGNCEDISLSAGSIHVSGDVEGDVTTTNGDVEINHGDVGGSVKTTNGDVYCGLIHGSVSSVNGDIKCR